MAGGAAALGEAAVDLVNMAVLGVENIVNFNYNNTVALGVATADFFGGINPAGDAAMANTARDPKSFFGGMLNSLMSKIQGSPSQGPRRFSPADREKGFERSKDAEGAPRCTYCGGKIEKKGGQGSSYEADHAVPYVRGGESNQQNLNPSCRDCNRSKGAKTEEEWAAEK